MAEIISPENISRLSEVTEKESINDCISWLLEHAELRGIECVRLQQVVKELNINKNTLKKELAGFQAATDRTADENAELKESLRSIAAMGKDEPCEQIEHLLSDVQTLTTETRKLKDELEFTHEELLTEKQRMSMLSASFEMLEYQKNMLEGEVKQANVVLRMLCK